jgi:thioredoxin 2
MAAPIVTCPHCGTRNRIAPRPEGIPRCANCGNALPWLVDADGASFDAEVSTGVPVVVDLWAPWCGPCRMVSPALEDLARAHPGRLKVVKVNIDTEPAIAARYGVQSIPLLLLIRDGREVDRFAGAAPRRRIEAWLAEHEALGAPAPS